MPASGAKLLLPPLPLEVFADYLRYLRAEKRLAVRTLALYEYELRRLCAFAKEAEINPALAQSTHLRLWVMQLSQRGLHPRSIALTLSVWRNWFAWMGREGRVQQQPMAGLRAPKKADTLPKALSVDDAHQLLQFALERAQQIQIQPEASPLQRAVAWRDCAILELLYGSGLRVGELVTLDTQAHSTARGWSDSAARMVHVTGKGQKLRSAPMGAKSLEALAHYQGLRGSLLELAPTLTLAKTDARALFLGPKGRRITAAWVWRMLRDLSVAAGLSVRVHPHVLRHSFASHLLQSSGDLRGVQELLGHANISSTQIYTRLDFQHLAKAYDQAHPRAKK